jgi:hypothetical protein
LTGSDELRLDRRGRGFILANLGELYLRRDDLANAYAFLSQALQSAEATGERIVFGEANALLGELEEARGDRAGADSHFKVAIDTLGQIGMPDRLRDCHMKYAEILEARADATRAAGHWKLAAKIGKSASGAGTSPDAGLRARVAASGRKEPVA